MQAASRRGVAALVPWAALLAMTVFAFVQVRERRAASERAERAEQQLRAVKATEPAVAERAKGLREWLADAVSADPGLRTQALERASRAGAGEVEDLMELIQFRTSVGEAEAVLALAPRLAPGERAGVLLSRAVHGPDDEGGALARLAMVPPPHLRSEVFFFDLLVSGSGALRAAASALLGPAGEPLAPDSVEELAKALGKQYPSESDEHQVATLRLLGRLRHAGVLRLLSDVPPPEPRSAAHQAAAIYAFARVLPADETHRKRAAAMFPSLLEHDDLEVRTAAVLLAEALLAERVAFDPAASPEGRRAALPPLAERLSRIAR